MSTPCDARGRLAEFSLKGGTPLLIFEVVAATVNDQIGRRHPEFLNLPGGDNDETDQQLCRRLSAFALALGLMKPEQLSTGDVGIDFNDAVGREVVVEFVRRKNGVQISFLGIWAIGDPNAPQVTLIS